MSALAMTAVTAGYGSRDVLHGCTLALEPGTIASVVGPNGAGKTTLLRVLAGLLRPRIGDVRVGGDALASLSRSEIARRVAVVPQALETLFPFTVREIVALGRSARLDALGRGSRDDDAAVARALDALELSSLAERRVDEISGGERQRAVVAMALAQETRVLLLDEPTVHLDPAHQLATLALVRRLAGEHGIAVLAIVHDLNLAALADRVVVLSEGRIVADGPPADVLTTSRVEGVFGAGWRVRLEDGRPVVFPG